MSNLNELLESWSSLLNFCANTLCQSRGGSTVGTEILRKCTCLQNLEMLLVHHKLCFLFTELSLLLVVNAKRLC